MRMVKHPYLQRIISIGRRNMGVVPVLILLSLAQTGAALAATAPPLGVVQSFAVLGATGVTATNPVVVTGDVGSSPTPSITGSITVVPPFTLHATNDAVVQQAQIDATAAVSAITPQGCDQDLTGQDLGTVATLTPGVYCFTSGAGLTGTLTLNGSGVYIFKIGTTLTTAGSSNVALNGADSGNVFWQIGAAANLGVNSTFRGTIFAGTSIGLGAGASLVGRAVAQTGAVTLDGNVSLPLLPTLGTVKSVQTYSDPINGVSSPKAIPGSFMLYTILATNTGTGTVDNNTTVIIDPIPANTELFVGDISGAGSGPVLFTNGVTASGLCYDYANPGACAGDSLLFSNNGGSTYTYTPTADANQCDASVTHLKISLGGIFSASDGTNHPSFSVKFRVRVK